jgi:SAM-dependent methyltransferase
MKECSKSVLRRLHDANFVRIYFRGSGIDIGGKPDPLVLYLELFPLMREVRTWDVEDGDAQLMAGVPDESLDFVHSSHCLEHLRDPKEALRNWFRILKPAGHLIVTVPDEDLYEQGMFPSTFNRDHKWTFTVSKAKSWSDRSVSMLDLLTRLGPAADIRRIDVIDSTYRYNLPRYDQTLSPVAEAAVEVVVRKRTHQELKYGGRLIKGDKPNREVRLHLNQYRDDHAVLRAQNRNIPPFTNDSEI